MSIILRILVFSLILSNCNQDDKRLFNVEKAYKTIFFPYKEPKEDEILIVFNSDIFPYKYLSIHKWNGMTLSDLMLLLKGMILEFNDDRILDYTFVISGKNELYE